LTDKFSVLYMFLDRQPPPLSRPMHNPPPDQPPMRPLHSNYPPQRPPALQSRDIHPSAQQAGKLMFSHLFYPYFVVSFNRNCYWSIYTQFKTWILENKFVFFSLCVIVLS